MEVLYQRSGGSLYSLAYRIVADQQVAEDLLQEAFVAVWRRATFYASQSGAVQTWLLSIVHHRAIDDLRRRATLGSVTLDEGRGSARSRRCGSKSGNPYKVSRCARL